MAWKWPSRKAGEPEERQSLETFVQCSEQDFERLGNSREMPNGWVANTDAPHVDAVHVGCNCQELVRPSLGPSEQSGQLAERLCTASARLFT